MRLPIVASTLFLSGGLFAGAAAFGQNALPAGSDAGPVTAPKKPVMFDLSSIDKTADPCTVRVRQLDQEQSDSADRGAVGKLQHAGGYEQLPALQGA